MRSNHHIRGRCARTLVVSGVALAALVLLPAATASAQCIGPTLRVPRAELRRGEAITIEGFGFGDNCYDTHGPPAGEGTLGHPLSEVTITFVQGERRVAVARGNADRRYELQTPVSVPASLMPGPVTLETTWRGGRSTSVAVGPGFLAEPASIGISPTSPLPAVAAVESFGPKTPATAEADPDGPLARADERLEEERAQGIRSVGAAVLGASVLAAAGVFLVVRRRRSPAVMAPDS